MNETTTQHIADGVEMLVHRRAGWTEIVATNGPWTDAPAIFDHTAFAPADARRELRNAMRRHARYVVSDALRRGYLDAREHA